MRKIRLALVIIDVCVIGGITFVSSTFAEQNQFRQPELRIKQYPTNKNFGRRSLVKNQPYQQNTMSIASQKIELVAPPAELPQIGSRKMTASLKSFAPVKKVRNIKRRTRKLVVKRPATQNYVAKASKPRELFTLVRLLNYAPHPLEESIFKQSPLRLGNSNYWFTVGYDEDWKVSKNDTGVMRGVSFEINVMENNNKIRTLKTPKVKLRASTIRKGQILGIAEVAPYKFTIKVDSFTKTRKGISELVFKLTLAG